MNKNAICTLLGFAAKAGKIVSGETGSRVAVQKKKAALLILAEDAAESTVNDFELLAKHHSVKMASLLTKHELGMVIGKSNRSVLVITDKGFAKQILLNVSGQPEDE
jgi:ribosomal protein L7Ae-like RNA K-turn-binding protein